jgi:hypothetical protein
MLMIRENVDAPAPGGDEATKPVSERAEVAIETPDILYGNVLVEYAQPNMRWLDDDNPIHKRVGTNLRKVKSL